MVLLPLKSISSQSGQLAPVASFHAAMLRPLRSPSFVLLATNDPDVDEALATPPLAARATLPVGGGAPLHASTPTSRLQPSGEALVKTLILFVVMAAKLNCRHTLLLPLTLPPGTVTQLLPFQYCTSYPVTP